MFAPSHTIPGQSCIFAHVAFIQLQIHSFYMVYALFASYIHWPVVSGHFAPCLDHFPAYFALFLPRMRSPQTSKKKVFFGHEKKPFDLQQKKLPGCFAPICHTTTIYTTRKQPDHSQNRLHG